MDSQKIVADSYWLGLRCGFFGIKDVLGLIDRAILLSPQPLPDLVDIALCRGHRLEDVSRLLQDIPGDQDLIRSSEILVGFIADDVKNNRKSIFEAADILSKLGREIHFLTTLDLNKWRHDFEVSEYMANPSDYFHQAEEDLKSFLNAADLKRHVE